MSSTTCEKKIQQLESAAGPDERLAAVRWDWSTPELTSYKTTSRATLKQLEDGAVLAGPKVAANETYRVAFDVPLASNVKPLQITAIRLGVLTDPSLPANGPGLAGNGNFVLTDVHLEVDGQPVRFVESWADHSQPDYPIAAAIDSSDQTGRAINIGNGSKKDAKMNAAHEAVFVLPVGGIKEDAKQMTFVMRHDRNPKYQVGRFAVDISMSAPPTTGNKDTDHQIAGVKRRMRNYKTFSAGGGIKPGHMHGTTDEPGFGQEEGRIHVHDLHATILHQLGIDHKQLTYRFQGRDFRLTDVHGEVIHDILV